MVLCLETDCVDRPCLSLSLCASAVQHECIPQAILGMDVICQAKSGMGKTAVFVLTTLQQLDLTQSGDVLVICLCHTRELAFQIQNEYDRFSKYMPEVRDTDRQRQKEIANANALVSPSVTLHVPGTGWNFLRPSEATVC